MLEIKPDLSIYLTNQERAPFPVIVECKRIDRHAKRRVHLYGTEELVRFIRGDYAWYAREAVMLAYVGDGSTIADCLTPHLEQHLTDDLYDYCTELLPEPDGRAAVACDLARSRHGRHCIELPASAEPGPIAIWHLWLVP